MRELRPTTSVPLHSNQQVATRPSGILVADDEASVRALLALAFRQEGWCVWEAASGLEALELYRQNRSDIGLAFLDIRMPGLDGVQAWMGMRALEPSLRCCFMTGQPGNYSHEHLMELGAVRVFSKPFRVGEIVQVARQSLEAVSK